MLLCVVMLVSMVCMSDFVFICLLCMFVVNVSVLCIEGVVFMSVL